MKLIKNNESYQVILPKQIVLAKQWQVNDELICKINENGDLIISKKMREI